MKTQSVLEKNILKKILIKLFSSYKKKFGLMKEKFNS